MQRMLFVRQHQKFYSYIKQGFNNLSLRTTQSMFVYTATKYYKYAFTFYT